MYIHRLRRTTLGMGGSATTNCGGRGMSITRPHRRYAGSGLNQLPADTFQPKINQPATDILRNLKVSRPRVPKKYINFEG
jgi:hypothetical protein|tara:strand:+ start:1482 stop:1721 length:240 start_codon:yes stop_codon:yes gene_type:complete